MADGFFSVIFGSWEPGGPWFFYAIAAIIITGVINGTLYAIAYAFNLAGLKRYVTSEFLQLAATAVMVIFLIGMIDAGQDFFLDRFAGTITCQGEPIPTTNTIDAAMCRTEERLTYFNNMFYYIKDDYLTDDAQGVVPYYFSISAMGIMIYQGMWDEAMHKYVETGHAIAYKIVSLLISLNSQVFVLKYIKENMLAVFLPLGILLRVTHFTRGIGGFFIALAISMYFIYPSMLFLMDASYAAAPNPPPSPVMNRADLCNMPVFSGFSLGSIQPPGVGTRNVAAISISSSDLAAFVSQVFVKLFYDNMVAFAIAMTAMRYGTMLLGGESGVFLQMMSRWV